MSEVVQINGKLSVAHDGLKLGDRVRLVIDGEVNSESKTATSHHGTEYRLGIKGEVAVRLGDEGAQFDDTIAELRAAQGEDDERQETFEYDGPDGDGEEGNLPLGDGEE